MKGYSTLIVKILSRLHKALLEANERNPYISEMLGFDIDEVIRDIEEHQTAKSQKDSQPAKKANASSLFDDFYAFETDSKP